MKIVAGLGNPGLEYDSTRHNLGWWVLDWLCQDWALDKFDWEAHALVARGEVGGVEVLLVKPQQFMNRSGAALRPWLMSEGFDPTQDLLVVVDDAALDVGRVRFRPGGSDGGHNGLTSVREVLGRQDFPRLRIGVGKPPPEVDLVDWVLSPMEPDDEECVLGLFPALSEAVELWVREGIEPVMNRFNR